MQGTYNCLSSTKFQCPVHIKVNKLYIDKSMERLYQQHEIEEQ